MSELKGQLLAMVITLGAFGAISGILITSFTNSANNVSSKLEAADSKVAKTVLTVNNSETTFVI